MSTIFISHSAPDHEIAEALHIALNKILGESSGLIKIRYSSSAKNGPEGGQEWREWIDKQVVQAKTAIIILSRNSITKPWPLWEAAACHGVALYRSQIEPESQDPLIIPLTYGITNDECPDPFRADQIYSGESPEVMDIVLSQILEHHKVDGNVFKNFGKISETVLSDYIDSVKKALYNSISIVTEATVQDWLVRLDNLVESNRWTELRSYQIWMNFAFGFDSKSLQRQIDFRLHRRLGDYYLEQEDFLWAIEQLQLARESAPRDIYVLSRLSEALIKQILKGKTLESNKKLQEEIKDLQDRIIFLDPNAIYGNPDTAALFAKYARYIENDLLKAIDIYENALNHNPQSYYLSDVLGQTQIQAGNLDDATKTYTNTLRILKHTDVNIWSLATKTTANIVVNDLDAAKKAIVEIIKLQPTRNQLTSIKEGIQDICTRIGISQKDKQELMTKFSE